MSLGSVIAGKNKYFTEGKGSEKICDVLEKTKIAGRELSQEGEYEMFLEYGELKTMASYFVYKWMGLEYPTVIYHHGAAEGSGDLSFNNILGKNENEIKANLIYIRAPFSGNNKEFMRNIRRLDKYVFLLSGSTLIVEKIVKELKGKGNDRVIVTGASLGGFVTNLHYTYFNTAEYYLPLLAGARLGDVFLDSQYKKVTAKDIVLFRREIISILNFNKDFAKRCTGNIYPVLGEYDQIINYRVQSRDFDEKTIKKIPYGHSTGVTKYEILREHILSFI